MLNNIEEHIKILIYRPTYIFLPLQACCGQTFWSVLFKRSWCNYMFVDKRNEILGTYPHRRKHLLHSADRCLDREKAAWQVLTARNKFVAIRWVNRSGFMESLVVNFRMIAIQRIIHRNQFVNSNILLVMSPGTMKGLCD